MNEFQRKHDEHIAHELIRLGKSHNCICRVGLDYRFEKPPLVSLDYALKCPVHYPKTSALLIGGDAA